MVTVSASGADADQGAVSDLGRMNDGPVPERDVRTDNRRHVAAAYVNRRVVLDVRARADAHAGDIGPHHALEPDRRIFGQFARKASQFAWVWTQVSS